MKQLFGFIAALVLLAVGGLTFVGLGLAPVAHYPHRSLLKTDYRYRVERARQQTSAAIARLFNRQTRFIWQARESIGPTALFVMACQGRIRRPSQRASPHARPSFSKVKGVSDDPAGETYWKVANGIRLTGMPVSTGP